MTVKWTPEQRAKYYENARLKRAEKALAAGRVPGQRGQPSKCTAEEKAAKHRARVKKYRDEHLEAQQAYHRDYERERAAKKAIAEGRIPGKSGPKRKYATDAEYLAAVAVTRKRYYQANREKLAALAAEHARKKREAIKAGLHKFMPKQRKTLDEKRAIKNAHSHKRRALVNAAGGNYTPQDLKIVKYRQGGICEYCHRLLGEHDIHLDHWVPLAKGGANHRDNLRLLHGTCNLQKGAQHPDEFKMPYEQPMAA